MFGGLHLSVCDVSVGFVVFTGSLLFGCSAAGWLLVGGVCGVLGFVGLDGSLLCWVVGGGYFVGCCDCVLNLFCWCGMGWIGWCVVFVGVLFMLL